MTYDKENIKISTVDHYSEKRNESEGIIDSFFGCGRLFEC